MKPFSEIILIFEDDAFPITIPFTKIFSPGRTPEISRIILVIPVFAQVSVEIGLWKIRGLSAGTPRVSESFSIKLSAFLFRGISFPQEQPGLSI